MKPLKLFLFFEVVVASALLSCAHAPKDYVSPDLRMRELKGNVEEVSFYGKEVFDENGMLVVDKEDVTIKRDSMNRIVYYAVNELRKPDEDWVVKNYIYDKNGNVSEISGNYMGRTFIQKCFYDKDNHLVKMSTKYHVEEWLIQNLDTDWMEDEVYTILERDKTGNWLKRRINTKSDNFLVDGGERIEERIIKYRK